MSQVIIVRDVKAYWANLVKPKNPFGTSQYDVQLQFDADREAAKQLKGLNIKDAKEGNAKVFYAKCPQFKRDGTENEAPEVVDKDRKPIDGSTIGNGSVVNVKLFVYDYDVNGRKGKSAKLLGVQVVKLEKYESGEDFTPVGDEIGF